jgi:hypothetical protein
VPTPSRWHPLPATAEADANSGGEDWEVVPEVMEAMEVIKAREVVPWKKRAMAKVVYASPSARHAKVVWAAEAMGAAKTVHAAEAMHAAKAVASKTAHRAGGQCHWRGEHRHHDSTSDCYFAAHDNPPDCRKSPQVILRTQCKMFK